MLIWDDINWDISVVSNYFYIHIFYFNVIDLKTIYIHSWPKKWHIIVKFFRLILLSIIFLYSSLSLFSPLLAILFVLVNASLLCCLSSIFRCITDLKGFCPSKNMFLLLFIWSSKWHRFVWNVNKSYVFWAKIVLKIFLRWNLHSKILYFIN